MNLKAVGLLLAVVSLQSILTIGVARWSFSEQSHATYAAIERLINDYDNRQENRMATISQMESRLIAHDGVLLEEVQRRIDASIARHLQTNHKD
ncbi:hypothetical protein ACFPU0_13215 [Pseudomonas sp. GCM10022186]|uniref:hypothetical protein n=1 Tax=Pseudomonas sp. GCM10022186 TaxID=3252650 RepID=UPI00361FC469